MGFKTIDLDAPGGYKRYNKMKETNSVKKAFEDEKLVETLAPRPEEDETKKYFDDVFKQETESHKIPAEEVAPEVQVELNIPKEVTVQGVVTGVDQLRVRTKPEGDIMYLISSKSVVTILEEYEGWYKVETAPGRVGWVMKDYIQRYSEGG